MIRSIFLPLLLALIMPRAQAAEVMPPPPSAHFNDYAGLVPPDTAQSLDAELTQFERDTSTQVVVAIFAKMQSDSSVEDYAVRVAQSWGIGRRGRNNGAVLFVFAQNHTAYISVGYGLEGTLTDALCKRIIEDELVPRFRQGDFGGGLTAGVHAILAATRHEYRGTGRTTDEAAGGFPPLMVFGLFLLLVIISSFRRHVVYRGSGRHGYWTGGVPFIFTGGGFGGGFGGGGFSGGGGSFGGGGAGGSW